MIAAWEPSIANYRLRQRVLPVLIVGVVCMTCTILYVCSIASMSSSTGAISWIVGLPALGILNLALLVLMALRGNPAKHPRANLLAIGWVVCQVLLLLNGAEGLDYVTSHISAQAHPRRKLLGTLGEPPALMLVIEKDKFVYDEASMRQVSCREAKAGHAPSDEPLRIKIQNNDSQTWAARDLTGGKLELLGFMAPGTSNAFFTATKFMALEQNDRCISGFAILR